MSTTNDSSYSHISTDMLKTVDSSIFHRGDPHENMLRDGALPARSAADGRLRVHIYSWSGPALSVGRIQHVERTLRTTAVAGDGLSVVRRPTGGRTILHGGDVSFACALPDPGGGRFLRSALHRAIALFLSRRGIRIDTAPCRDRHRRGEGACFALFTEGETTVQGRKICGIAFRRTARAILAQGTIPLTPAYRQVVCYLKEESHSADLTACSISLEELTGRACPARTVMEDLSRALTDVLSPVRRMQNSASPAGAAGLTSAPSEAGP
ncbi:MAG: lipoate--protein ligase family protein [Fibrobacterota bacterium]